VEKRCVGCDTVKPEQAFGRSKVGWRPHTVCRVCRLAGAYRVRYLRNRSSVLATAKRYRAQPGVTERRAEMARAYRSANRARLREEFRRWRAENPEAAAELNRRSAHIRRCRLMSLPVEKFSAGSIFVRDKGLCAYCGLGLDPMNWHLDHVVPVSRGGGHTRDNVVASCPRCNLSKYDKTADEFKGAACDRS